MTQNLTLTKENQDYIVSTIQLKPELFETVAIDKSDYKVVAGSMIRSTDRDQAKIEHKKCVTNFLKKK